MNLRDIVFLGEVFPIPKESVVYQDGPYLYECQPNGYVVRKINTDMGAIPDEGWNEYSGAFNTLKCSMDQTTCYIIGTGKLRIPLKENALDPFLVIHEVVFVNGWYVEDRTVAEIFGYIPLEWTDEEKTMLVLSV